MSHSPFPHLGPQGLSATPSSWMPATLDSRGQQLTEAMHPGASTQAARSPQGTRWGQDQGGKGVGCGRAPCPPVRMHVRVQGSQPQPGPLVTEGVTDKAGPGQPLPGSCYLTCASTSRPICAGCLRLLLLQALHGPEPQIHSWPEAQSCAWSPLCPPVCQPHAAPIQVRATRPGCPAQRTQSPHPSPAAHTPRKRTWCLFCSVGRGAFLSYVEVKAQRPSRNSTSPGLGRQLSSQTCWEDSAGPSSPVALPCTAFPTSYHCNHSR